MVRYRLTHLQPIYCPDSFSIESPENLKYYVDQLHFITAGRLLKCEDEYRITEFYSQKADVGFPYTDFFCKSRTFQFLKKGRACVMMISVARNKEIALPYGQINVENTIHFWTDLEKYEVVWWGCSYLDRKADGQVMVETIKKFFFHKHLRKAQTD